MENKVFTVAILFLVMGGAIKSKAQGSFLYFSYDNQGNRVQREIVTSYKLQRKIVRECDTTLVLDNELKTLLNEDKKEERASKKVSLLSKGSVSVYPNPASLFLKVTFEDSDIESFKSVLYDGNGRILLTAENKGQQGELDISALPSAYYFLEVRTSKEKIIWKVIKQ